jgi:hypothetical protein
LNDEKHFFELKALCISQTATNRSLNFYFQDDNIGIINDFKKLDSLCDENNKWVIGFVYPKPTLQKWNAKAKMPEYLGHWNCITNLQEFPDSFFISVWKSD